ncbi:uncharacterized protein BDR25DRAFT_332396 [Lindgomyces ingoldianus]|uniref:Uncharacterized protein n=1 Tax=Lindgomyces ingoldianus TaxID=673940 RepID=A0ACB6R4X8_9PLEO|nr:uncharacterized protein BDR25DRAFT_332396 [Lindgomyces ingoldianus]KAF2474294.1 hypothetical protein BDR25DRAFT_332396 [Lindgomyces ingoldianus]
MAPSRPVTSIISLEASPSNSRANRTYLVYFITGNPGLIQYYYTFLTHLFDLLSPKFSSSISLKLRIFGRSLSGFEVDEDSKFQESPPHEKGPPYGLEEQITQSHKVLEDVVCYDRLNGGTDVRVILVGHSVGAYILLEIIRRTREKAANDPDNGVRIAGGICLFPTVTHISHSPSGRKSSWLLNRLHFAHTASIVVKVLTLLLPFSMLSFLVSSLMSFPSDAARVTTAFVKSKYGVRQALYARDEMLTITSDRWDAEIWGAAHPSKHPHPRPALRFLFAKADHWVADETRDDLIKVRGLSKHSDEDWKPIMEVDEVRGWPHGFCIKHSIPVAERVKMYIDDVIQSDLERP